MTSRTPSTIKARGSATYTRRHTTPTTQKNLRPSLPSNHSARNYQWQPHGVRHALQPIETARKAALLLVSKDQESVIVTSIQSAIASGQDRQSIFVLDQHSTDRTRKRAIEQLGVDKVISLPTGTVRDIQRAIKQFTVERDYQWLFVADADVAFGSNYFHLFQHKLDPKQHVLAVGFSQSLHGNWINTYRDLAYSLTCSFGGFIQLSPSWARVLQSPVTGIRTDALRRLKPDSTLGTFDTLLQVHRLRLGKVLRLHQAVSFTPQRQSLSDFCRDTLHAQRNFFLTARKYQVSLRAQRIDGVIGYQFLQTAAALIVTGIILPLAISRTHNWMLLLAAIAADYLLNTILVFCVCLSNRRHWFMGTLPYFYLLRWVELGLYLWAFVEVIGFDRYQGGITTIQGTSVYLELAASSPPT